MQTKKQNENCLIANTTSNMKKCTIAAVLFLFSTVIFGQKINGQWRVSVDAGSMMGMAKNKVNTTTGSWRDSAKNVLKRINTEGIKKKINNMLDSIKIDIP